MENKLVSVLIPVYNVDNYVKEAIESIQNQTYKNLEIIVVDDGSIDNTFSIIEKLAKNDNRIKLYKNEKNLKIVKTLNRALSLANGEYIARMDGDDISAPDRIEKKVKFLEENKEFDLVGCSMVTIDSDGVEMGKTQRLSDFELIKRTLKYVSPVSHIWLARKKVYDKLNGYREMPGAEDYDFLLRMISSDMKCTNLTDYYGYYVRLGREGNTVSTNGLYQRKMHYYIYKLYEERVAKGYDSFTTDENIKSSQLSKKLFYIASIYHQKALESFSNKNYFKTILYTLMSFISPYKVHYYYYSFRYRLLLRK